MKNNTYKSQYSQIQRDPKKTASCCTRKKSFESNTI